MKIFELDRKTFSKLDFGRPTAGSVKAVAGNIRGQMFTGISAGAGVEFTIAHNLNYIPSYYIVMSQDAAGSFYLGTTAWDKVNAYLKCSAAGVNYNIFIH